VFRSAIKTAKEQGAKTLEKGLKKVFAAGVGNS
jgi:hypothetical protein